MKTHFKPTETFQYTEFTSCHPPGVKKGFIKGEALRLLRTNSSRFNFEENIAKFKRNLIERGYPEMLTQEALSEVKFQNRNAALKQKPKKNKRILPFVTQYQPISAKLKTNPHEKLAFNRTTTTVKRNFQGTSYNILYKGAFTERYTR